jgi:hypothetical protein
LSRPLFLVAEEPSRDRHGRAGERGLAINVSLLDGIGALSLLNL